MNQRETSDLINIRIAKEEDANEISDLFRGTVQHINARDYQPRQIEIWSAFADDIEQWEALIANQFFYVAMIENDIVGFSSIIQSGYLDFMYIHKDHQGKGIATKLLKQVEAKAQELQVKEIFASVSNTAKPFFESKGYRSTEILTIEIEGVIFKNDKMVKLR